MESDILQEMRQAESHFNTFEVSTAVKIEVFWDTTLCPWVRVSDGPEVDSASNRNEYQELAGGKGGRFVGLMTSPPSCADCLEIWEPQPPGILWVCPGLYRDFFCFIIIIIIIIIIINVSVHG